MFFLLLLHSFYILACFRIDADDIAFAYEHRDVHGGASFKGYLFGAALHGVATHGCGRFLYFKLNFNGKHYRDYFFIKNGEFNEGVGFHKFAAFADQILAKFKTLARVTFLAEPVLAFVRVEILDVAGINICFIGLLGRMEGALSDLARDEILQLGLVYRLAHLLAKDMRSEYLMRGSIKDDKFMRSNFVILKHNVAYSSAESGDFATNVNVAKRGKKA